MTPLSFTIPGQASRAGLALLTSVFCVGLARPLLSSATAGQEGRAGTVRSGAVELEGSDTVANDDFGWSVALAARTVVVGAPAHAASAGRAYVFVEEATGWRQAAELVGSDTVAGDEFGYSVAISQDTVVVGSIGPPSGPGRAYVFSGSTGRWRQTAEFQGPSGFGRGVAICGDNVVVGSPRGGPTLAAEPGRAFLFSRSASGWHKAAELMPANGAPGDGFGASVAIGGGNTVLVGSPDYRSGAGRAYVFARSGPGWHQTAELGSPKTAPLELFGESASVSGGTIVVGAAGPPEGPGSAYVFRESSSAWRESAELKGVGGAAGDSFGQSVWVAGGGAVVGAPYQDEGAGRAYVFSASGSGWRRVAELGAQGGAVGATFGTSVAVSPTLVVVGALGGQGSTGGAYVFPAGPAEPRSDEGR